MMYGLRNGFNSAQEKSSFAKMNYIYYSEMTTLDDINICTCSTSESQFGSSLSVVFSGLWKKKQENKLEQRLARGVRQDLLIVL